MNERNQANLQQILSDKKKMQQVASSPDAKALAQMLTKGQSQASLKRIAENAAKGDTAQLSELIRSIASSPGGAQLLSRLSGTLEDK